MTIMNFVKYMMLAVGLVAFYFSYYDFAYADVGNPFQSTSGDPEVKIGSVGRKIIEFLLYVAMVFGGIGIAWGLSELNGWIGEKAKGMEKIKIGAIVLSTAGIMIAIIAKFAGMSA